MDFARAISTKDALPGRVPPQNIDAEESVLGSILIDQEALHRSLELLSAEDFYRDVNRQIFGAMIRLYEKSEPVDLITLTDELRQLPNFEALGGTGYLAGLTHAVSSAANVQTHAKIVKEKSVLRQMISKATEIIERGYMPDTDSEDFIDDAEKAIYSVSEINRRQAFFSIKDIIKDSIRAIEQRAASGNQITGISTGFSELDKLTCGFQASDLIIVAGRPSMGKTAFCLNVATHAAIGAKTPTAIFSLEMSKEQLVIRMLCSEARIDSNKVRTGSLDEEDWRRLIRAASALSEAPLYIDDTPSITPMALRSKARRMKLEKGIQMVLIDYLQLMRRSNSLGPAESREREISEISRALKALAKELSLPVVAISQLNRSVESRQDKRPMMSDLRESGALEQDADLIGFIYRDEVYNKDTAKPGVAEFILSKQRNGPTGTVEMAYLNKYTRFENLDRG